MIEYENLRKVNSRYEEHFREAFDKFTKKGRYILDNEVELFETEFAKYCGSKFCVGVASGFDALYLSLLALDLPKGSQVLIPSNTYIATVFSVLQAGLRPVLVEPRISTYNFDPRLVSQHVNSKTKAIIAVHLYGKPCEMDTLKALSEEHGLYLLEDCAQAHGATFEGKKVGTFGIMGAFSFYPTKNLGALGDAGAIITDDPPMAEKLRSLRNYGSEKKYQNKYVGINSRLDELQAAFLRIKLRHLDEIIAYKIDLANLYLDTIINKDVILPVVKSGARDVWHIFNIRHPNRNQLREYLLKQGIGTEIHYPVPPHKQTACLDFFKGNDFAISDEIHQTTLSLPVSVIHTHEHISYISKVLNSFKI